MATVRAFLAVPLPPDLQERIGTLQNRLAASFPGLRLTRPETVHLTLRFFGDTCGDDLEKIRISMLSVKLREKSFAVEVSALGAFPGRRRPRVLWLGLTPREPLDSLFRSCQEELLRAGIPAEPRAFEPHLTIGRFREPGPDLSTALDAYAGVTFGRMPVGQLVLFESRLLPGGARHTPLFTVPLQRDDPLNYRT